ncbi:MAG: hypothetical protein IT158_10285 [Bryobacterales bacterium]|nr:hypothetical protein [Bryobacterales bacterium]
MNGLRRLRRIIPAALAGLPAYAQCSMCRNAAAAQGQGAADSFNSAILILLVPAVALFSGVFLFTWRSAARTEDPEE